MNQINFPVYKLGSDKPVTIEGVILYYKQYTNEDGEPYDIYSIVDDLNIDKPTLALRRLELLKNEVKLKKLGRGMFFLADLIKLANRSSWFIDSSGTVFQYQKQDHSKLIFKKIKQIIPIPTGGAIIEVEGITARFKTLYMPDIGNKYAGLLKYGIGYILYGIYPEQLNTTRRMI